MINILEILMDNMCVNIGVFVYKIMCVFNIMLERIKI